MRCEEAQDLILTDHLDGRLSEGFERELRQHLAGCERCREFLASAKETLVGLFEKIPSEHLPPAVIESVLDRIEEERSASLAGKLEEVGKGMLVWLGGFRLRPALVFSCVLVCLLVIGIMSGVDRIQAARNETRGLYLASIVELSANNERTIDYGTALEDYFLQERGES
ncbi:MAG: hypothetical protein GX606_00060 [Elusimicrobia bacterium]|nr:hypothetical protein [Elusimicrobiota bacterium]